MNKTENNFVGPRLPSQEYLEVREHRALTVIPSKPSLKVPKPEHVRTRTWRRLWRVAECYLAYQNMTKALKAIGYAHGTAIGSSWYYLDLIRQYGILDAVRARKQIDLQVMADDSLSYHLENKDKSVAMFIHEQEKGKAIQKSHVVIDEIKTYRPVMDVTPDKPQDVVVETKKDG